MIIKFVISNNHIFINVRFGSHTDAILVVSISPLLANVSFIMTSANDCFGSTPDLY